MAEGKRLGPNLLLEGLRISAKHGVALCRRAIALNPHSALAHRLLAIALARAGQLEDALEHVDISARLSPQDPDSAPLLTTRAMVLFVMERYKGCAEHAAASSRSPGARHWVDLVLIASLVKLGHIGEVEEAKRQLFLRKPDFTIGVFEAHWRGPLPEKPGDLLREAGLPE